MDFQQRAFEQARRELAYAFEHVPFFHQAMESAGVHPRDVTKPEDFARVPATRKADYRRNFPAGVLAAGKRLDQPGVYQIRSSGTEGERLITAARGILLAQRMSACLSVHPGFAGLERTRPLRTVRYAAPSCSDVECANPNRSMQDRLMPDGTLVLPVLHDLLTTPEAMMDTAARELAEHRPALVYADPAHLAHLCRHLAARARPPPAVPWIAAGFSLCTAASRRQILAAFAAAPPAFAEVVAMSELGWLALECPRGRLHLNTRSFFMELVADGRAARPGELAELAVTSLGDDLSPHIRYHTGDLYRLVEDGCPCGHAFPAVRAEGRRTQMIVRGGEVVLTPRGLDEVVGPAPGLDLYQLEQRSESGFVLRLVAGPGWTEREARELRERVAAALGPGAELAVEPARYVPAERSGKLLSCKSAAMAVTA